ncbi:uracil-DNA glycosylase family protein [Spiribacter vilamensis]|uniref:Uracil-DNA glycosylase n=1 Tax=Spiribacter vilamensis TaxID=531306 RepID=A0A4V2GIX4_9GAMM|nr:uracil-DNA glycosylase family protein [Spiribacter vilamensis]RZU98065.1 uracil-DNA glycosylase [Spiribacter vilamensis]TVO61033.1 uracil-DNA glycosylase [Spiribacter vilamensis]
MRDLPAALMDRFRYASVDLAGRDEGVYEAAGRPTTDPIFGLGPADARIAFFGRDPGRDEVHVGVPFIGAGGRQVRRVLFERHHGGVMRGTDDALMAGRSYFWANTVPYKPKGNKAWSMAVKRRFQPLVAEVLCDLWHGGDVITLGREAFFWFGLGQSAGARRQLEQHWQREDRFEQSLGLDYRGPDDRVRQLTLHPLPHPSPLNATWFKHFPGLLAARLDRLEASP